MKLTLSDAEKLRTISEEMRSLMAKGEWTPENYKRLLDEAKKVTTEGMWLMFLLRNVPGGLTVVSGH